jgi:hypothetical protein
MFPTHDMNPIAVEHMRRERLDADIAFVDRQKRGGLARIFIWLRPDWIAVLGRHLARLGRSR